MKKIIIILIHALIGWGICGAIIGIGRSVTSMDNTLIIHAIAVPIVFAIISFVYHKFFNYTKPVLTAFIFLAFAMLLDAGLVAPVFEKSYDMFKSILGTWIPFALIFLATYIAGLITNKFHFES
jgi:hypothetical protein